MKFTQLKIDKKYVDILKENYIVEATKIQEAAIPAVLTGRNVIGKAQTGTGKTLAFLLPIFDMIDEANPHTQVLILAPTRELANQITDVAKMLGEPNEVGVVSVFGGHNIEGQIQRLKNRVQIVVGTPGRILDHLRRGTINFKHLKHMVIDEADQMLAFGFLEDIELLSTKIPEDQQILLFSATMPENIINLAKKIIHNPIRIDIDPQIVVLDQIKQLVIKTTEERRTESLLLALEIHNPFMAMVFTKSKQRAKELYNALVAQGYTNIEVLHGDLTQSKREQILKKFRSLALPLLITTDIAARGMDIEGVTHVFNYDVPKDVEYYIHRVGRTGRMENPGVAVTLVDAEDEKYLTKIEKHIKLNLPKVFDRSEYERSKLEIDEIREMRVQVLKERVSRSQIVKEREGAIKGRPASRLKKKFGRKPGRKKK